MRANYDVTDDAGADVLEMPEPIGLQPKWLSSPASRKVLRVGRRGTKTRFAFCAAILGHGPGWEKDEPTFGGVLSGGDVVWICPTYSNLTTVLWREEIVPRMAHLPYVDLNVQLHDVNFRGLGALLLRSGDRSAIDSVRGVGKRLKGVIVDEAAWLDLRGALLNVILPALLDNDGWLILMSTTNAGKDGGLMDTGEPQIPSYFNVICEEVRAGSRSKDWEEFVGTAFDNPTLNPVAINELIAEYTPDSPSLQQEVYAALLKSGVGLALPNVNADRHIVPRFQVPRHWTQFGGFDWGYNHPWVFGWYAADEDGNVIKVDTISSRNDLPNAIASKILLSGAPIVRKDFLVFAGHDIWQKKGEAVGYNGPTIEEQLTPYAFKLVKANTARVLGLDNLRRYTHFDDAWPVSGEGMRRPRFTMMDTPGNRACLAQLQGMQLDPDNLEDALKVDADMAGRGGDDTYDETRYALMSRPLVSKPVAEEPGENQSPGYDYENQRPRVRRTADDEMASILKAAQGSPTYGRYRAPRRT